MTPTVAAVKNYKWRLLPSVAQDA